MTTQGPGDGRGRSRGRWTDAARDARAARTSVESCRGRTGDSGESATRATDEHDTDRSAVGRITAASTAISGAAAGLFAAAGARVIPGCCAPAGAACSARAARSARTGRCAGTGWRARAGWRTSTGTPAGAGRCTRSGGGGCSGRCPTGCAGEFCAEHRAARASDSGSAASDLRHRDRGHRGDHQAAQPPFDARGASGHADPGRWGAHLLRRTDRACTRRRSVGAWGCCERSARPGAADSGHQRFAGGGDASPGLVLGGHHLQRWRPRGAGRASGDCRCGGSGASKRAGWAPGGAGCRARAAGRPHGEPDPAATPVPASAGAELADRGTPRVGAHPGAGAGAGWPAAHSGAAGPAAGSSAAGSPAVRTATATPAVRAAAATAIRTTAGAAAVRTAAPGGHAAAHPTAGPDSAGAPLHRPAHAEQRRHRGPGIPAELGAGRPDRRRWPDAAALRRRAE